MERDQRRKVSWEKEKIDLPQALWLILFFWSQFLWFISHLGLCLLFLFFFFFDFYNLFIFIQLQLSSFSIDSTCSKVSLSKGQSHLLMEQTALDTWSVSMVVKRTYFKSWKPISSFSFSLPGSSVLLPFNLSSVSSRGPVHNFPTQHLIPPFYPPQPHPITSTLPTPSLATSFSDKYLAVASHHTQSQFQATQHGSDSCVGQAPKCLSSSLSPELQSN